MPSPQLPAFPFCLALIGSLAACSLNPQPEPPLEDRGIDASWNVGGAAGASMGGAGGGSALDASTDAITPYAEAGSDCGPCDCNCMAGGECDAGVDGACSCDASPGDSGPDAEADTISAD